MNGTVCVAKVISPAFVGDCGLSSCVWAKSHFERLLNHVNRMQIKQNCETVVYYVQLMFKLCATFHFVTTL